MLHEALTASDVYVGQLIVPGAIGAGDRSFEPHALADRLWTMHEEGIGSRVVAGAEARADPHGATCRMRAGSGQQFPVERRCSHAISGARASAAMRRSTCIETTRPTFAPEPMATAMTTGTPPGVVAR